MLLHFITLSALLFLVSAAVHAAAEPKALIVKETYEPVKVSKAIASRIAAAGYEAEVVEADMLEQSLASSVGLLVLADSAHLPASAGKPIQAYLELGGKVMALRAPLWQTSLVKLGDKWVSTDEYQRKTAALPPGKILFDFKPGNIDSWTRTANPDAAPATYEAGAEGPAAGLYSLHCHLSNLNGWDNIAATGLESPFPKGHTLTVFSAKGGPRTTQIAIEWAEKDGARWIATVPVDSHWRRYVLRPEDFKFWIGNPKRGFRGDRFRPENAVTISFGLAFTHTGLVGGEHEFWVGPVGTANADTEKELLITLPETGPMDLLYPDYKFFDCTGVARVKAVDGSTLPASGLIKSPHPRPEGRGYGKGRSWRFVSLATAYTSKGEWRGTPAAMMIHSPDSKWKGGVWACFGFQDPKAYEDETLLGMIEETARRMLRGLFLLEGGTNFYTYFEDDPVKAGAAAVNLGSVKLEGVKIEQRIVDPKSDRLIWSTDRIFSIDSSEVQRYDADVDTASAQAKSKWPKDGLICITTLSVDGKKVDEISHEVNVWKPKKKKQFITTGGGNFLLNGKPWKAHGVNYMPSSGIGIEDGEYFEHWIGAAPYDPGIIQRDLDHIKDLGMNSVSVFIYSGHRHAGNLLDLLRRCENLGIKVNLSLRPGTPMDFLWDEIRAIIERYRLWENDTVIAYDLAWEPAFPDHEGRKKYDAQWEEWIKERYGSIENAEADWGYQAPREDGKITNPPDALFVSNGEWRRMMAAYRRFLDDLLYYYYNRARTLVKSVDPNHLVSFRMSEAGNPTFNWDRFVPYDFAQLAAAVDFLAPEAYGRIGEDWEKVKPGWFEREYARWAAPEQPMIWAEVGVSTWDVSWMRNTDEKLRFQKAYFEQFYKMAIDSRANGIYWWWYPGGFRYGENSDYGIINPDGSDRPSSQVIRKNARKFLDTTDQPVPDTWIEIDRDADSRGIFGIYEKAKDEFWKLVDQGKKPGLRTAGTGTTSANCPLVAVGNTRYDDRTPPKYLNSAFDKLEILDADGNWVEVKDGTEVVVDKAKPVTARAVLRNLGEAKWLAGDGKGCVEMVCHIGFGKYTVKLPHDVPKHGITVIENARLTDKGPHASTTVAIFMQANGRAKFGEAVKVKLTPRL